MIGQRIIKAFCNFFHTSSTPRWCCKDSSCVIEHRSFIQATNPARPPGNESAATVNGMRALGVYEGDQIEGLATGDFLIENCIMVAPRLASESSGTGAEMHISGVRSAVVKTQSRSTVAPRWACSNAPFGMRLTIFQSRVDSMCSLAALNIMPGNNS